MTDKREYEDELDVEYATRIEVDFEDYGFRLFSDDGTDSWIVELEDPEVPPYPIHDPENDLFFTQQTINGRLITQTEFQEYQNWKNNEDR